MSDVFYSTVHWAKRGQVLSCLTSSIALCNEPRETKSSRVWRLLWHYTTSQERPSPLVSEVFYSTIQRAEIKITQFSVIKNVVLFVCYALIDAKSGMQRYECKLNKTTTECTKTTYFEVKSWKKIMGPQTTPPVGRGTPPPHTSPPLAPQRLDCWRKSWIRPWW